MAKLSQLFDLHRIAENSELQDIIDDTHKRYPQVTELSDDDLELAAAGRIQVRADCRCSECGKPIAVSITATTKMQICPFCGNITN